MLKRCLVIIFSIVIFLAAILLGMNKVFSISSFETTYSIVSQDAQNDAKNAQEKLEEDLNTNCLFYNKEQAEKIFSAYPYLSMTEFEKKYPNKIILKVKENSEVYAIKNKDNKYNTMDIQGNTFSSQKDNLSNNIQGNNIEIIYPSIKQETFIESSNYKLLISLGKIMDEKFNGIRTCIRSITLNVQRDNEFGQDDFYDFETAEGVVLRVINPNVKSEEKMQSILEGYIKIEDENKMYGRLEINDNNGEVMKPVWTGRQ